MMKNMVWVIPVDKVKFGIMDAFSKSLTTCDMAIGHLELQRQEIDNGGSTKRTLDAVPLLYYALEELGKAMILYEELKNAKAMGVDCIKVPNNVGGHDVKMNRAKEAYGELIVRVREPKDGWEKELKEPKFEPLEEKEDIIANYSERADTWLASWNPEKNEWKNNYKWIDRGDVKSACYRLKKILHDEREKMKS